MSANRTKLIVILCLLLGMLFLSGCSINMKRVAEIATDNREQLPIRSLTITIDTGQREELFDQLREFAEKHGFEFLISDYGTGGEHFMVEMLGNHIKIIAVDIPKAPTMISIDFYDQNLVTPVPKETIESIDD